MNKFNNKKYPSALKNTWVNIFAVQTQKSMKFSLASTFINLGYAGLE